MKTVTHNNLYFIVNTLTKGGAERQVLTLQRELGGRIVLLQNIIQYDDISPDDILVLIPHPSKSFVGRIFQYFQSLYKLFILLKFHQAGSAPVAISFLERSNVLNLITSFFTRHTCILSVRINLDIQYVSAPIFRLFAKRFYRYASKVTTNSQGMRRLLVNRYNIKDGNAIYMPNAYDIPFITQRSKEFLTDLNLDRLASTSKFMLSVNRLDDQKLIKAQLELYAELKVKHPDTKLFIVGDGPSRDSLIAFSTSLQLNTYSVWDAGQPSLPMGGEVYFLGLINNPYRLYNLATCLLLTSKYESLPNVLIEGLICNSTVVAGDCRFGPREILANNIDYNFDYKDNYGIKNYGILLPVPDSTPSAHKIWIEYLSLILTNKLDVSFKQTISEKIVDYEIEACVRKWSSLI